MLEAINVIGLNNKELKVNIMKARVRGIRSLNSKSRG